MRTQQRRTPEDPSRTPTKGGRPPTEPALLMLQRTAGNRAVTQTLQRHGPISLPWPIEPVVDWFWPTPDRDETIATTIRDLIGAYEHLDLSVPAYDPKAKKPVETPAQPTKIQIGTPYSIASMAKKRSAKAKQTAKADEKGVYGHFSSKVKLAKATPEELRAAMQTALDAGVIRSKGGGWPPTADDAEAWMAKWGLGVDCSGFVYHALERVDASLTGQGMKGLSGEGRTITQALGGTVGNVGSAGLRSSKASPGDQIKQPGDLGAGDIVFLKPSKERKVGHIRIITSVREDGDHVVYQAAESTEANKAGGPTESLWRVPADKKLELRTLEFSLDGGKTWQKSNQQRPIEYWRRLPEDD